MCTTYEARRTMPAALALLLLACALALQAAQAQPAAAQPKEQQGSIEGRTVSSVTGQPVRRVLLLLVGAGGAAPITKLESDENGAFVFRGLGAGTYQLIAEKAGFARQSYGAKSNALAGTGLVLSTGQQMKDVVFKLAPDAVISGRVLDEDGEPVPGAVVLALRSSYQRGEKQWQPLGTAQANDLGEFRLPNLTAGSYVVAAAPRMASTSILGISNQAPSAAKPERDYITTYYPSVTDMSAAVPVPVAVGQEARGTDIRMGKVNTVRIRGNVTGVPDGKPVLVRLIPKGAGIIGVVTGKMTAIQQGNGAFELAGVAPGSYVLTATTAQELLGGAALGAVPLQVGDQHIEGIVLGPGITAELPGALVVEGKDAVKLSGIKVVLQPREFVSFSVPSTTAGEDGKFTLKSLSPDRYIVQLSGAPDGSYVKRVKLGDSDVTEEGIDFSGGVVSSTLQVTLSMAAAQVDGVVQGKDDKPVSGATVVLVPDSRRYSLFKEARTGDNGSYTLKGVAPGEYRILAWEDLETGAYQDPDFLKRYESRSEKLSLKESDRKSVTLKVIPVE